MVIAPATASTLGKMANGIADNMLVTTYLSAKEPVMVAPAMDLDMMAHPSTARNLATLRRDGVMVVEPAAGELASHLVGKGRMEEPENIFKLITEFFAHRRDMEGMRVAITAGPTHELLDPVRFIGNYSSGKMGYALARECAGRGAKVTLISGPVDLPAPEGVETIKVTSAREMLEASKEPFAKADIGIFAAAVADYRPEECSDRKIKREGVEDMTIRLVRNPDIAATLCAGKRENQLFAGFALETDHEHENAVSKLRRKGLDMVVLNSLNDKGACFGTDTNKITLISRDGSEKAFPLKSKQEVARDIIDALTACK